jgi:hypothetical protein
VSVVAGNQQDSIEVLLRGMVSTSSVSQVEHNTDDRRFLVGEQFMSTAP